jgi:hypothetical protein
MTLSSVPADSVDHGTNQNQLLDQHPSRAQQGLSGDPRDTAIGCDQGYRCRFRNLDSSVRTDDVARQGSDAQQRLRTARSGVFRARPSQAKHAFAPQKAAP